MQFRHALLAFSFTKSCGEASHHGNIVTEENITENVNIKRNTRRALVNQKRRLIEHLINQSLVLRSKYRWLANSVSSVNSLTNSRVWRSGESTCLPPMWPGFDFRTRCQMWIEFVGSLLCYERFSPGYSGFPLSPKTNI